METNIASPGKRIAAYLLDIIPIVLFFFGFFYAFFGFDETLKNYLANREDLDLRRQFLVERNIIRNLSFISWIIYGTFMESSRYQGTFGKVLMKIRVTDYDGRPIPFTTSLKRNSFKIISKLSFAIGFIWSFFDKQHRSWHDMVAKTLVKE